MDRKRRFFSNRAGRAAVGCSQGRWPIHRARAKLGDVGSIDGVTVQGPAASPPGAALGGGTQLVYAQTMTSLLKDVSPDSTRRKTMRKILSALVAIAFVAAGGPAFAQAAAPTEAPKAEKKIQKKAKKTKKAKKEGPGITQTGEPPPPEGGGAAVKEPPPPEGGGAAVKK